MKLKLNLSKLKFKELLVEHIEKAVFAGAAVCLLLFIFSAVGREKLPADFEHEKLADTARRAQEHLANSEPDPTKIQPEGKERYANRVRRDPVQLATYETKAALNPPIIEARVLRDEPLYLTIRELRVNTGFAPIAVLDPKAAAESVRTRPRPPRTNLDEPEQEKERIVQRDNVAGVRVGRDAKLEIRYWAMVTGLVPVRDQKKEYVTAFENAVNYEADKDVPVYLGYIIERAEVTSGDMSKLDWKKVPVDTKFMRTWSTQINEPVMPEFVTPMFVMPLAPRVGSNWEPYVAHLPSIPLETKRSLGGGPMGGMGGMGPMGRGLGMPGGPGGFDGMGPMDRGMGGMDGMGDDALDEEGEELDFQRSGLRGNDRMVETETPEERRRRNEIVAELPDGKSIKGVDNLLFRFCDFSVQPGKQYVYRVTLGLRNPNYQLPAKFVKKPDLAKTRTRVSKPSEPSPIAMVPHGDQILAGPTTPPTVAREPTAEFRVVQVKDDVGALVPLEATVRRGTITNFKDQTTSYVDPITSTVKEYKGDFFTQSLVVDIRGGRPVLARDRDVTEPGELLLLDRLGNLVALNEFDDEDAWNQIAVPDEDTTEGPGMGPSMGFPGGPGGPLGPGGPGMLPGSRGARQPAIDPLDGSLAPKARTRNPRSRPR